ncbi:MAG: hypothetical protein AB7O97_20175 [Planctomycetota bacterium]
MSPTLAPPSPCSGDPRAFAPVHTVVRPLPDHAEPPFPHADTLSKPVLDARGQIGVAVELPDVYDDTRTALLAATGLRDWVHRPLRPRAPDAGERARFAALLDDLTADLRAADRPCALLRRCDRAVLRALDATFTVWIEAGALRIELPRWPAPPDALRALRWYAARLNADVQLARLELGAADCAFAARLPLAGLSAPAGASLRTATWMCLHALRAIAQTVPELAVLLDPQNLPRLGLVPAAAVVPSRSPHSGGSR